jgi:pimeloyl-ACP methyl ester carboxylesterase
MPVVKPDGPKEAPVTTFVLIHGSWHGGWCWRKVVPLLQSRGHRVYTPTLTGLGERSHLLSPEVDLGTHIRDVCQVLEYEDLGGVALVGHSYAGMVLSGVAEQMPERIGRLIYLDALVPQNGQCGFDVMPGSREGAEEAARARGQGWFVPPPEPQVFGVEDPADVSWMKARLCPMPLAVHEQTLQITNADARKLPKGYLLCVGYQMFSPAAQRAKDEAVRYAKAHEWDVRELKAPHDSMVTAPRELSGLLIDMVAT